MKVNNVLKAFLTVPVLYSVFFSGFLVHAEEKPIDIYINNQRIALEESPILQSGTTMVPFRTIFTELGLAIVWDQSTQTVTGRKDDLIIELQLDNPYAKVNGHKQYLTEAPHIVNGSTFVPLRFIGQATGNLVTWDGTERSVRIKEPKTGYRQVEKFGGQAIGKELLEFAMVTNALNTKVIEKDGYLYVFYNKGIYNSKYYVSIAKEGKWVTRDHLVTEVVSPIGDKYRSLTVISGNSIYTTDTKGLKQIKVGPDGKIVQEDYIVQRVPTMYNSYSYMDESLIPIYSNGTNGVLFGEYFKEKLYFEGSFDQPIIVNDPDHKIKHIIENDTSKALYYNQQNHRLINFNNFNQLDVVNGVLLSNNRYDPSTDRNPLPTDYAAMGFGYDDNKIYYVYSILNPTTNKYDHKYTVIDEEFNVLMDGINTTLKSKKISEIGTTVTISNNEIHGWEIIRDESNWYEGIVKLNIFNLPQ
ncbi:copper amine oxidase N-terminal domain-containing protein [Paenibacillus sp. WQ 127069]|uniref:Copper amine oxidase N-terminal domain-containing protein n=1 Tax=Paenibacillus baimaensis TaxID=2982185 RepID=A0ABT2UFC2_9BACL|nr:copper amine oxidase N-terminal domain-containing protein [Paenibacillus sp. WQ 127069]MCU6793336.1 copper amine oxidase N-terminal domain-containing protein [Paenibacillus sp. WQ 127069]